MNVATDRKYAKSHEWAKLEDDGTISVGISDHAQQALGDIVFLELPEIGRRLTVGDECAVVESVKAAADIYAPVSGSVIDANRAAADAPETVNRNAYATWLFRIKPDDAGKCAAEIAMLLDPAGYGALAESE